MRRAARTDSLSLPFKGSAEDSRKVRMASDAKTYRRDDGVLMIEVEPGQFISEKAASLFGNIKSTIENNKAKRPPKRGNYGGRLRR